MKGRYVALTTAALAALLAVVPSIAVTGTQQTDETTRQIIAEEFLKKRPAPAKTSAAAKKPAYRLVNPSASPKATTAATMDLGVTLWRLRPSQSSDEGARLLVQDSAELSAERLDAGAPLNIGDRVRLTIESPAAGFLYVIDREINADGTMSEGYLIFPTLRTRNGDNAVRPGRLIDIPDQLDRPNYFSVRPSRPGQVGELITILVTPERLSTA